MDPVVGNEDCKITDVCILLESLESYQIIVEKIHDISLKLRVPADQIRRIKTRMELNTMTPFEAINEILAAWRSKTSDLATLSSLVDVLKSCGLDHASDVLYQQFVNSANNRIKQFVNPPEGFVEFLQSPQKILVVCTLDKNVTTSKLRDTTTSLHTSDHIEFVKNIQLANDNKLHSFECSKIFNLTDVLNLMAAHVKYKVVIVAEERLEDATIKCIGFDKIKLVEDMLKWSHLSPSNQVISAEKYVKISGKRMTLKEFTRKVGSLDDDHLDQFTLLDIVNDREPNLDKSSFRKPLPYYTPRRINLRHLLISERLFNTENESDIFIFSGIYIHELAMFTKKKKADTSTRQKILDQPTVQYMVLHMDSEFKEISEKFGRPTHWIRHEKGKFYWLQSSGKLDTIQKLIETRNAQTVFEEETFLKNVNKNVAPVIISDTPGMGKTRLLSSLAAQLVSSGNIVLFGDISAVLKAIKTRPEDGQELQAQIIDVLSSLGGDIKPVKAYLKKALITGDDHINVMMDGLDEINDGDLPFAGQVLKTITKLRNIRLWVTSRPHYLGTLENWFQVPGYQIHAFNSEDQLNCLVKYWKLPSQKLEDGRLNQFAKACLRNLFKAMNMESKKYDHIAGIPLQCLLIGEVFKEEARSYANSDVGDSEILVPSINLLSITDLYTKLIEKKLDEYFEKYPSSKYSKEQLKLAHTVLSIQLLFPEWEHKFKEILQPGFEVNTEDILKVGLFEKLGPEEIATMVHRTIGEYFVADFVMNGITRHEQGEISKEFLGHVLESVEIEYSIQIANFVIPMRKHVFKHFVIVTFMENFIQPTTPHLRINAEIRNLAQSCISGNYVNLFNYFDNAKIFNEGNVFDKELVFSCVKYPNLELIDRIVKTFEKDNDIRVRDLGITSSKSGQTSNILFLASRHGHFSVVQYLVEEAGYSELLQRNNEMTHDVIIYCVADTSNCSDSIIFQKVQILKLLYDLSPPQFKNGKTTKMIEDLGYIHITLLCELITLGLDLLTDGRHWNILFYAAEFASAKDFHRLVSHIWQSSLSDLLRRKYFGLQENSIEQLISEFEPRYKRNEQPILHCILEGTSIELEPRTFQLFKNVGADFNIVDKNGNSVLDAAIEGQKSIATYEQLVQHGASLRPIREKQWTILHTCLGACNFHAFQYFSEKLTTDGDLRQKLRDAKNWNDLENVDLQKLGINLKVKDKLERTVIDRVLPPQPRNLLYSLLQQSLYINIKALLILPAVYEIVRNARAETRCFIFMNSAHRDNRLVLQLLESCGAISNKELAQRVLHELVCPVNDDEASKNLTCKLRSKWKL